MQLINLLSCLLGNNDSDSILLCSGNVQACRHEVPGAPYITAPTVDSLPVWMHTLHIHSTHCAAHCLTLCVTNPPDCCLQDQFTTFLTDGHSSFIMMRMVRLLRLPDFCTTCISLQPGPVGTLLQLLMPMSACKCACAQELWCFACLDKPLCPAFVSAACACPGRLSSCFVLLCSISVLVMSCCYECSILQVSPSGI